MKISDKIAQASKNGQPWWSFEFFPPRTEDGWVNLYDRIERMQLLGPIFVDITFVSFFSLTNLYDRRAERMKS